MKKVIKTFPQALKLFPLKQLILKNSALYFALIVLLISGCAVTQPVKTGDQHGGYIGYSDGKYVRLYYRIEDSVLTLTVENRSILPLYQVIFSVEQKTTAGSIEGQSSLRLLRKSSFHTMNLNIPANSTGEIIFTCYFETAAPDPNTFLKEYLDDRIVLLLMR